MVVYQIYKVYLALMYIQHKHMVYSELKIHHFLVLDQNANNNAYSNLLRHEVWNVDHKMVILGINLCWNKFSHIGLQHQHYTEHDSVYLSILILWIVFYNFPDHWHHFCGDILSDGVEIT